ncbi:MAG: hypothetical protein AMS21_00795 [Gemmatimonas sp. SG8_38_2]|nr:MAG: hypothetical protein AMS21_00795 [Gemmatimonas sp. SG8_38_2]
MRRGLFDRGFEDFGLPGNGLPSEMVFSGLGGFGAVVSAADLREALKISTWTVTESAWLSCPTGGDIVMGKPVPIDVISKLTQRLNIVGVRKDPRPPVGDQITPAELTEYYKFMTAIGLQDVAIKIAGGINREGWAILNWYAGKITKNRPGFSPIESTANPYVDPVKASQPSLEEKTAAPGIKPGETGNRVLVKDKSISGGSGGTTSPSTVNEGQERARLTEQFSRMFPSYAGNLSALTNEQLKKLLATAGLPKAQPTGGPGPVPPGAPPSAAGIGIAILFIAIVIVMAMRKK